MATTSVADSSSRGMTREEKKVIFASSLGTVFEWYDFYLYGSLAAFIGAAFFSEYPEATRNIFALLAFAAGFLVRPFGALVFGRIGDLVGRKYTFLVTILIMGLSTFLVGVLPGMSQLGHCRTDHPDRPAHASRSCSGAVNMAVRQPTSPNTRRVTDAAITHHGFRLPPPLVCSSRLSSS